MKHPTKCENSYFIEKLDDCVEVISKSKEKYNRIIYTGDLVEILFEMLELKHVPYVYYFNGNIMFISFKTDRKMFRIENSDVTTENDNISIEMNSLDEWKAYHKADDNFYARMFQKKYKSEYPENVRKIDLTYKIRPLTRYCSKYFDFTFNFIDQNKAYTNAVIKISSVSVFEYFDQYQEYNDHKIEEHTMYIV